MNLRLYFDGAAQPKNPGIGTWGFVVCPEDGVPIDIDDANDEPTNIIYKLCGVVKKGDMATNNEAEYWALGMGLKWISENTQATSLTIYGDSQLVVYQVNGLYECRSEKLIPLRKKIMERLAKISDWRAIWIPRHLNSLADELSDAAYREFLKRKRSA